MEQRLSRTGVKLDPVSCKHLLLVFRLVVTSFRVGSLFEYWLCTQRGLWKSAVMPQEMGGMVIANLVIFISVAEFTEKKTSMQKFPIITAKLN